jgi:hypothetical protein
MLKVACRRAHVSDVDSVLALVADDSAGYRQKWGAINVEQTIESRCVCEGLGSHLPTAPTRHWRCVWASQMRGAPRGVLAVVAAFHRVPAPVMCWFGVWWERWGRNARLVGCNPRHPNADLLPVLGSVR